VRRDLDVGGRIRAVIPAAQPEAFVTSSPATPTSSPQQGLVITPGALLAHWQGHRRLTRRVIAAFPEKELFEFSIGGMRPFSELAFEFLRMGAPFLRGLVTGEWKGEVTKPTTREEILRLWDEDTKAINELWAQIPVHRFQRIEKAFGQWEGVMHDLLFYNIDNEIHHRGQGYVYLRALGIEPPAFYDRS
jgi:uncharacterized damage-inducible protein DinB